MTTNRLSLALIGLVSFVAACESAESKRMKAIAGDYVSIYASEISPGQQEPWIKERRTLSLHADGTWTMRDTVEVNGKQDQAVSDGGTYRIQGTTLSTRETEQSPSGHYTISGDTLWIIASDKVALTKAVTGVDLGGDNKQGFLVRRH
jgi:hypothetical protein